jgi:hypothetical protein
VTSLPYGPAHDRNSGWSGTQTSKDAEPSRRGAQEKALQWLEYVGEWGSTWNELADASGLHHGAASGALSVLDKDGKVRLLAIKRGKCHVYVLPQYVNGRALAQRRRSSLDALREENARLEQTIEEQGDLIVALRSDIRTYRDQRDVLNRTRRQYEALLEEHEELKRRLGSTLVDRLMGGDAP